MQASFCLRRTLISEITGAAPGDIQLGVLPEGAPILVRPAGWSLSIANKRDITAVALGEAREAVGVDVEIVREIDWRPMLPMLCSDDERARFEQSALFGLRSFFRLWTLKEAVLKSTQQGFRAGPKAVAVPLEAAIETGNGCLTAFGAAYEFWSADVGDTIVSLVRRRTQEGARKAIEIGLAS